MPVAELQAKASSGELNSSYFDSLVSDDLVDDLLSWLSDPKGTRDRWEASRWEILCSRCIADYGFDPALDGELVGAEKLGLQEKPIWKTAWKRFATVPLRYVGLLELLRKAKPMPKPGDLFASQRMESWPQDNEAAESSLRQSLAAVAESLVAEARKKLIELERAHYQRRQWVWAKINRSPLAQAVEHLATLAQVTQTSLTGATTADMVKAYTEGSWRADAAVLGCLGGGNAATRSRGGLGGCQARLRSLAAGCRGIVSGASQTAACARPRGASPGRRANRHLRTLRRWPSVRRGPEAPRLSGSEVRPGPDSAPIRRPSFRYANRQACRSRQSPTKSLGPTRARSSGPASIQAAKT